MCGKAQESEDIMAELFHILNTRSSIRGYSSEKLTDEEVKTIVEFGLKAPTARNEQELHFTVLGADHPLMSEIGSCLNAEKPLTFLYGAPTLILISGRDDFGWTAVDAGIAVENMHLGAKGLDLGSVIIGCIAGAMTGEKKAYFHEKLGIPEGYTFQIALAVGHPVVTKEQHIFDYAKNVNVL